MAYPPARARDSRAPPAASAHPADFASSECMCPGCNLHGPVSEQDLNVWRRCASESGMPVQSQTPRRRVPMTRSQTEFALGLRGGLFSTRRPSRWTDSSTSAEKMESRSCSRSEYRSSYPTASRRCCRVRCAVGALPRKSESVDGWDVRRRRARTRLGTCWSPRHRNHT